MAKGPRTQWYESKALAIAYLEQLGYKVLIAKDTDPYDFIFKHKGVVYYVKVVSGTILKVPLKKIKEILDAGKRPAIFFYNKDQGYVFFTHNLLLNKELD